jgi:hypothetical protein
MADFYEGLNDLSAEGTVAKLIAALEDADQPVKDMLGADSVPRIWEGEPPKEIPAGATWKSFYPCILVQVVTQVSDIWAIVNEYPGDHIIGTTRLTVKGVGQGTGFTRLKPIKRFIFATLEGATGEDVEGGSIACWSVFLEWPREKEQAEGGLHYYHHGYQFDVIAKRGESEGV